MRDPLGEAQQRGIEQGLGIKHVENFFRYDGRRIVVQRRHHSGQAMRAEGHQHAPANHGLSAIDAISKRGGQRDWQRHVTELWHQASVFAREFADFAGSGRFK